MRAVSDLVPTPSRRERTVSARWDALGDLARRSRLSWKDAQPFAYPPRAQWPLALRRLQLIGCLTLAIQLLAWAAWSSQLASRSALTLDYGFYSQAVYLIAHGHLDPYSTVYGLPFWQNDSEFIFWPASIFELIWPHVVTLKWVMDVAVVAAEAVAFTWMCEVAAKWHAAIAATELRRSDVRLMLTLVAVGLLMMVADPWLTWTVSFDVHAEPMIVPFVVAAARDLYRGRRIGLLWLVFVVAGGGVPATYAGALGLTLLLSGRRWAKQGLAIAVIAIGWESLLHKLGGVHGAGVGVLYWRILGHSSPIVSSNASLGTLAEALILHPGRGLSALWYNRTDMWATVAPLGVIGMFWLPALIPALVVLVEGGLTTGYVFAFPGFQNLILVPLVAIGTVSLCFALATRTRRRRTWAPWLICGLLTVNAVVWGAIWLPQTSTHWLRVPAYPAAALSKLRAEIGPDDEVIAEQGIVGAFSNRRWVYPLLTPNATVPVKARAVWVIFAPEVGVETADIAGINADIGTLSRNPEMHLRAALDGVFAYEWLPSRRDQELTIGATGYGDSTAPGSPAWDASLGLTPTPRTSYEIPAWVSPGQAGGAVMQGPLSDWRVASNGSDGYVVAGDYWLEPAGSYHAEVSLSSTAPTNVELWNATTSTLLDRVVTDDTHGRVTVSLRGLLKLSTPQQARGWGLWRTVPESPAEGDDLEIRVDDPGGGDRVSVYTLRLG